MVPTQPLLEEREEVVVEKQKKKRRPRTTFTCEQCRHRKIKCDRNLPCSACRRRGAVCEWQKGRPLEMPEAKDPSVELFRLRRLVDILATRAHVDKPELESLSESIMNITTANITPRSSISSTSSSASSSSGPSVASPPASSDSNYSDHETNDNDIGSDHGHDDSHDGSCCSEPSSPDSPRLPSPPPTPKYEEETISRDISVPSLDFYLPNPHQPVHVKPNVRGSDLGSATFPYVSLYQPQLVDELNQLVMPQFAQVQDVGLVSDAFVSHPAPFKTGANTDELLGWVGSLGGYQSYYDGQSGQLTLSSGYDLLPSP